jgi:drug/metabolite transporter (DMT)-like permease
VETHGARRPAPRPYLVLAVGVLAVSSAAILVSLARAQGVPALAIAALRMSVAALVVVPIAVVGCRPEIRGLRGIDILLAAGSGILLALHFAFWISSLDSTSVMSSVVLVSTNPVFVGIASALLLRERPSLGTTIGIAVAVIGGAVVGLADLRMAGGASIRGDVLALLGALAVSGYLLIGRRLRKSMSLRLYVGITYLAAALTLLAIAGITSTPLAGYPTGGYLWVLLLAAGPQLLGHSSYNWALKYVTATFVTVTLLAEPIGATLLAIPVLGQVPAPVRIAGGALILAGVFLAARAEARPRAAGDRGRIRE